jgi:hypothetical protein
MRMAAMCCLRVGLVTRGKLKAALARRRPDLVVPAATWSKRCVVHCTAWGEGDALARRRVIRAGIRWVHPRAKRSVRSARGRRYERKLRKALAR